MKGPVFQYFVFCADQMVSADLWRLCTRKYIEQDLLQNM